LFVTGVACHAACCILLRGDTLHASYIFMAWCLFNHSGNFTYTVTVPVMFMNKMISTFEILRLNLYYYIIFILLYLISGRSAEWTQLESTPHYTNLKIIMCLYYLFIYCFLREAGIA
jgi:hypothetical protein